MTPEGRVAQVAIELHQIVARERDEARARASTAEGLLREVYDATAAYFEEWGAEHEEDDCPEDDTCSCPLVTGVNAAFARARAFLDGEGR